MKRKVTEKRTLRLVRETLKALESADLPKVRGAYHSSQLSIPTIDDGDSCTCFSLGI